MSGTEGSVNPFRFQAGYGDTTGFYKFGTRYYSPTLAAWTQPDPSGLTPGYAFAGDNPINYSDPTGLCGIISCITEGITKAFHAVKRFVSGARGIGDKLFSAFGVTGGATAASEATVAKGVSIAEGIEEGLTGLGVVIVVGDLILPGSIAAGVAIC